MAGLEVISAGSPTSENQVIFSTSTITTTTSGAKIVGVGRYTTAMFFAKATAVTGTSPTFDVYIQTLLPDNTTWQDIAHFTQITGTSSQVLWFVTGASSVASVQTAALSAATVKAIGLGGAIRATCVVAGTSPSASLTVYGSFFE